VRWLLLIMVFEINSADELQPRMVETRTFQSEDACNEFGRRYRRVVPIDRDLKSFSICLPEDAFDNPLSFRPDVYRDD
jgi:hypothetical protein